MKRLVVVAVATVIGAGCGGGGPDSPLSADVNEVAVESCVEKGLMTEEECRE